MPHLLRAGADPDRALEQLKRFTHLLLEWNRGASNLISARDEPRILERHLVESVQPAQWLQAANRSQWLDLGSGGGFPAIPLAMCGVGSRWTLVESRRNKSLFLRKVVQECGLKNVDVICDRLENLAVKADFAGRFDGFTSRATMKLSPTLDLASAVSTTDCEAYLWKGSSRDEEMASDDSWLGQWRLEGLLGVGAVSTVVCRFIREK